ncbi:MAG: phosphotransferase family protein [Gemmatimonadetes bacterium]|nr:phosphotransferase family protein [Gemmatimonadota bacterium]
MINEPLIDAPAAVRDGEALPLDALRAWWTETVRPVGPLEVEQFPRGFSNLTYLVRAGGDEFVLRRPPFGVKPGVAHDVLREGRLLAALRPAYPHVPAIVALCEDAGVIGAPFFVMERVRGLILRGAVPSALAFDTTQLRALSGPDGYVERQVAGWSKRWSAARTGDVASIERVAAWLAAHAPGPGDAALVHNDLKFDNLVLDPADPTRVRAVLDWEMATIGDPRLDLATTLGYWIEANDPPPLLQLGLGITSLPGNWTRQDVVAAYETASGRSVGDPVWLFAFGVFKVAVIAQQIYARYVAGHTRDPRFAHLDVAVATLGDVATRAIDANRISALA